MGTSPTEPFRFPLNFPPISNQKKLINMPKGAGLTKPMKLSADLAEVVGKKEASVLNASNNFGHTSRRTISRTPKTNNSSTPTRKWQRFLEPTAFVPLVWPSSFPLTCLQLRKVLSILYVPPSFMDRSNIYRVAGTGGAGGSV